MAEVTIKQCDVYGSPKADSYRVTVTTRQGDGEPDTDIIKKEVDLSPRALARLEKFIEKGVTPPRS